MLGEDGAYNEGVAMTKSEIVLRMESADGIYGTMYGGDEEDYVFVPKCDLREWEKDTCTGYYFIWGYPGPDYNVYLFSDYGRTWSFDENDLIKGGHKKYG